MNKACKSAPALLCVLLTACAAAPGASPGSSPIHPSSTPDLSGLWLLTTHSPVSVGELDMRIVQTGHALAGTLSTASGPLDFTGSVRGQSVAFGFMLNAYGSDLHIDFDGLVEGDTMKGRAVFGSFGEGEFLATRKTEGNGG